MWYRQRDAQSVKRKYNDSFKDNQAYTWSEQEVNIYFDKNKAKLKIKSI